MKPAVEVRNVSKSYIISHQNKPGYNTLKDDIGNIIRTPFSKGKKYDQEEFWALKNISFDINKGEIFGIIGRNGSGKSTLLKILSRIVDPSKGSVILRGRTASLLEVGTGFHPELTGRENVYLNGSMLGMSRQQIKARFDQIVEFSEIEKFIDTPVKFYSSGMYVRLAFAVAAHLEPDILILDEVLSVGDASFQKKSLDKILETMHDGRTVIFVSHGMDSVVKLCTRALWLQDGEIKLLGKTEIVADAYLEASLEPIPETHVTPEDQPERVKEEYASDVVIKELACLTKSKEQNFLYGEDLSFTALIESKNKKIKEVFVGLGLEDPEGKRIFTSESDEDKPITLKTGGSTRVNFVVAAPRLQPGDYSISLGVREGLDTLDFIPEALNFRVDKRDRNGISHKPLNDPGISGYVTGDVRMEVQYEK